MKQITEDYVSYEVAQLLKEKGFDESVYSFYKQNGFLDIVSCRTRNSYTCDYAAPTHQMALKWLKEVHNVFISPDLDVYSNLYFATVYTQLQCAAPNKHYSTDLYKEPEQAVEAVLDYVLKNLI